METQERIKCPLACLPSTLRAFHPTPPQGRIRRPALCASFPPPPQGEERSTQGGLFFVCRLSARSLCVALPRPRGGHVSPPCALHPTPPQGRNDAHRAGFFCAPTVFIFYQAVYSKPPNYQVIVLVNCTLILAFLLNVCTAFEHIVERNQSDKTLRPLPLIARACRIKSCKLPSTIRYSPK